MQISQERDYPEALLYLCDKTYLKSKGKMRLVFKMLDCYQEWGTFSPQRGKIRYVAYFRLAHRSDFRI